MRKITTKEKISIGMAVASLLSGLVMLFMSMFFPPEGEISSTVLYAFGELSLFAGSVLGISIQIDRHRRERE